ncbi:hypothetical protein L195_g030363 [Trifolium pratense]|uniref:Uncharacterized protein n=1 Tax=Trifolium pratense TaxID=57577 RepID=A0A2K3L7F9_TRIPR|nr:hypothetical protein L195_g030363 [Trifolium pratense]
MDSFVKFLKISTAVMEFVLVLGALCLLVLVFYEVFIKWRRLAAVSPPPVNELEMLPA